MSNWNYDISPDRRQAWIIDEEGFTVAEIAGYTDMTETVELMTAAPDLLEALKWLTACVKRPGPHMDAGAALEKADAAIAKATYTMEHKA